MFAAMNVSRLLTSSVIGSSLIGSGVLFRKSFCQAATEGTIYQFTVEDPNGKMVSLEKYRGKVVIIANVASECGYTDNNYKSFKDLLVKYKSKGFEIACFPCNQFGNQEKGCALDVETAIKEKYAVEPDFYAKIDVNGKNEAPLYTFLKKEKGGLLIDAIKWNFTLFTVDRNGKVIKRYGPSKNLDMDKDIEALL